MNFFEKLHDHPESISFAETMALVAELYDYTPVSFRNGEVANEAGQNEGSCKLFAMAQLNDLSEQATLHCFGEYYREDVLLHPDAQDHQNIRHFMRWGWAGLVFDKLPLTAKVSR